MCKRMNDGRLSRPTEKPEASQARRLSHEAPGEAQAMSNPDESAPPVRIDVCHADIDPLYAILNDPRANERRLQERLLQRRIQAFIEGRRHQLEALAEAWHRRWPE